MTLEIKSPTKAAEPAAKANPANAPAGAKSVAERKRIPMSIPQRKLEIPEGACPGYHLYWFLGRNVARAQQGGYEFVHQDEVVLNNMSVATDATLSGSADMGTRVSVIAGEGPDGQPEHLYLMKLKSEWYDEDRKVLEARNKSVVDALQDPKGLGTEKGERPEDVSKRYVKKSLFGRQR